MNKSVSLPIILAITLSQAACSLSSLNPFDGKPKARGKYPENAVEYRCDENKRFAVQIHNQGNNAWLIYPDHQVNLNLTENADNTAKQYESGVINLTLQADQTATLQDGENSYIGCKAQMIAVEK